MTSIEMEPQDEEPVKSEFQKSKNGWIAIIVAVIFLFVPKPVLQNFGAFLGFIAALGIMRDERKLPSIIALLIGAISLIWTFVLDK